MACEKCYLRRYLRFAFQLKKSAIETTKMIYAQHWERTCEKSYQRFKAGNFNLEDNDRSGASKKFDEEMS